MVTYPPGAQKCTGLTSLFPYVWPCFNATRSGCRQKVHVLGYERRKKKATAPGRQQSVLGCRQNDAVRPIADQEEEQGIQMTAQLYAIRSVIGNAVVWRRIRSSRLIPKPGPVWGTREVQSFEPTGPSEPSVASGLVFQGNQDTQLGRKLPVP